MVPGCAGSSRWEKLTPHFDQFLHTRRTFLNNRAHNLLVAEAGARFERVPQVQFEGILARHHRRNAALCVVGVAFGAVLLRDDGDAAFGCNLQGKGQPGNSTAEHDEIELADQFSHFGSLLQAWRYLAYSNGTLLVRRRSTWRDLIS